MNKRIVGLDIKMLPVLGLGLSSISADWMRSKRNKNRKIRLPSPSSSDKNKNKKWMT